MICDGDLCGPNHRGRVAVQVNSVTETEGHTAFYCLFRFFLEVLPEIVVDGRYPQQATAFRMQVAGLVNLVNWRLGLLPKSPDVGD